MNKVVKVVSLGTVMSMAAVATASADIAAVQSAIIAKIGEAETFGYALLAVGLVATIGIVLVKRWAKKGIS
jgi:hypothetical protein